MEAWQTMLMQAYDMRALVVLLDGVDEAAGLRDQIELFVHKEVVPSGNRVLVTSRPEGVKLETYSKNFVVMNLNQLTNEQQRAVINVQMQGNQFFDHLLSLGEVRKNLDDAHRKIGAVVRNDLETLWGSNLWQYLVDGVPVYDPEERQKEVTGQRIVQEVRKLSSEYLLELDATLRYDKAELGPGIGPGVSLLDHVDQKCKETPTYVEHVFEASLLEGIVQPGQEELHHRVAVKLGVLLKKEQEKVAKAEEEARIAVIKAGKAKLLKAKSEGADKASASKKEEKSFKGSAGQEGAPAAAGAPGEADAQETEEDTSNQAKALWRNIAWRTDEIYIVHEHMRDTYEKIVKKMVIEVAGSDEEANALVKDIQFADFKNPVRLYEKAHDQCAGRFKEKDPQLVEACISDVTRGRVSLRKGSQIKDFVNRVSATVALEEKDIEPIWPSVRAEKEAEAEEAAAAGIVPGPPLVEIRCMYLENKFDQLDPTHFRCAILQLQIIEKGVSVYIELEVHFHEILRIGTAANSAALEHYDFFRKKIEKQGSMPETELKRLLEEKLVFLVDAVGIPVLLSLLVLIFTSGGEDLTKLPSNRIELYEIGIESAVAKRLLPGGNTTTDQLIHQWLRLFNLDRSAMVVSSTTETTGAAPEKKEREHKPTRKASLSMELSSSNTIEMDEKKAAAADASKKKAADAQGANKTDKKLLNLDSKEVYEVFRHGAHYLREANNPEVQRTELNRIELSMPKKLVDTVMMLVNANLKMCLNGRAQSLGLMMLRHVAVSNQLSGRREFSAVHVAQALLLEQVNTEGITLWMHLNKEEAGLPLTKTLEAQTELAPAQYQFKHLSFQEGLFAQDLLIKAEAGWETWETDALASEFLNNPFMNNTCRIAAGYLGTRLAKRRPHWDFSKQGTRLSEVGLQALWLICENNEKIQRLDLQNNNVGSKFEDGIGLSRMLSTSTALTTLKLGTNVLGELKGYLRAVGRGLSSNKTLTSLDMSSNQLLPDGIRTVCNALRTCTAMKELNLSYNSPGREAALAGMLQMHPTLRSVGIVEKEPTTRSERTWWLDTRAKEMIGRALLSSPTPKLEYLQCDLFSLTESVETLAWKSKAPCDAIVLAGVLRCNSVLKTLNLLGSDGEIGDYEREEIGMALISNKSGKVGYSDMYGLKEGMSPTFSVDLKDKDQIRSKRAFVLFAGLLRANSTLTRLSLSSVIPEHIDVLADALATNTTLKTLVLEQPSKSAPTAYATLPVQQLNGHDGLETIDMFDAGGDQPVHKHACAVVGAILGAQMGANTSIRALRINPGGGSEGGLILDHLHRARRSSLVVLDLANIGLSDRGGTRFFESLLAGKCPMLTSLLLGSNGLTDLAIGQLVVEVLRQETCNISTLDLHDNLLGAPVIAQAIKYNTSLTSLNIAKNPMIADEGLQQLGGLLLEQNCTCKVNSMTCDPFEIRHGSDEILIHDETLGAGAAQLLFGVLKYNALIQVLNLRSRGIQPNAASILAVAVQHNSTLRKIDLSDNALSDVNLYTGSKPESDIKGLLALAKQVKANKSIEEITLEGGTLPVDQLKGDKKVRVLDLSRKSLSYVSAIFMGTLISVNTYMNELIAHSNNLSPNGIKFIVKNLQTSLKMLDVSNCVRMEERGKGDKKGGKAHQHASASSGSLEELDPKEMEEMWAAVSELGWLEKLTMDRDHLTELPSLGKLLGLKTLSLSNNKLTALPDDINLLAGLKNLTLHGNQLTELNAAVGELEHLEKLDLRSNRLLILPTSISKLRNLKQLDVSENQLQTIDPSICDLHAVERVEFKDNPLVRPPASIARQGVPALRKHFQEIVTSGDLRTWAARLVLLGNADSGKTSLQRGLRRHLAGTKLLKTNVYEPTNHLQVESLPLGEGAKQVQLSIWDLTGHKDQASAVQQYIKEGSIYVLCVPAASLNVLNNATNDWVARWLSYLSLKAPKAIVIPVLTKCDLVNAATKESLDRSPAHLETQASAQLAWLNEQLDAFDAVQTQGGTQPPNVRIQRPVQCVASSTGGEPTMEAMKARLEEILYAEDPKWLPQVGQLVSRDAYLTSVFIRALRDGREPIDSARAADIGYIPSTMSMEHKPGRPYMSFRAMAKVFGEEFAPALKMASDEQILADALALLATTGEALKGPEDVWYLHTGYLPRLLRPFTEPRMGGRLWLIRNIAAQEAMRAFMQGLPPLTDHQKNEITFASECLDKTGELREELLPVLWDGAGLRRDEYRDVIQMLMTAGQLILSENTQRGRRWLMPSRAPGITPEEGRQGFAASLGGDEGVEVMGASIQLGHAYPPSLIDFAMAKAAGLGAFSSFWRTGGHLKAEMLPCVTDVLMEVREVIGPAIMVSSAGSFKAGPPSAAPEGEGGKQYEMLIECIGEKANRQKVWHSLMHLKANVQAVLDDLPGLKSCRAMLRCPGCVKAKPDAVPTTWNVEDIEARAKVCELCGEQISLQSVTLGEYSHPPNPLLIDPPSNPDDELKFVGDKLRFGKPMENFFGLGTLLGISDAEMERLRSGGEGAIIDEFLAADIAEDEAIAFANDEAKKAGKDLSYEGAERVIDHLGWTDLDWVRYLGGKTAELKIFEQVTKLAEEGTQKKGKGWMADLLPHTASDETRDLEIHRRQIVLAKVAKDNSLDAGREFAEGGLPINLNTFLRQPIAKDANLTRGHVLALRLFSSRIGRKVNAALHDGCAPNRPHPMPALVIQLYDAVWKLRLAQIEMRHAAKRKVQSFLEAQKKAKEEADEDALDKAIADHKEAVQHAKTLVLEPFWRGVDDVQQVEFKQRGCCEVGFTSLSRERPISQMQAETLHMERHLGMGLSGGAGSSGKPGDGGGGGGGEAEEVHMALAPGWEERLKSGPPGKDGAATAVPMVEEETPPPAPAPPPPPAASTTPAEEAAAQKRAEVPLVMLKVLASADDVAPADISSFSIFPSEGENVWPPNVFFDMGKVFSEYAPTFGYKMAEIAPVLGRNLLEKKKKDVL